MNKPVVVEDAEIVAPPAAPSAPITPMMMIATAIERDQSVEVIEKLMALQERWDANKSRKAFDMAMAEARAEIPVITKGRTVDYTTKNGRTNYSFEDLASIAEVVDPILSQYGLSYRFRSAQNNGGLSVTCIIAHRDGYSEETTLSAGNDTSGSKNSIQAIGSAATYLQRYTLKLALGLSAAKDDDAQSVGKKLATISPEQYIQVRDKAAEAGVADDVICEAAECASLQQIPSDKFQSVMKKLEKTIAAKGDQSLVDGIDY